MTTTTIRKKLIDYIADADEKKVKGMYMLFENEIEENKEFKLSNEQMKILERERKDHLAGRSESYSWTEAKGIIRGKRKM